MSLGCARYRLESEHPCVTTLSTTWHSSVLSLVTVTSAQQFILLTEDTKRKFETTTKKVRTKQGSPKKKDKLNQKMWNKMTGYRNLWSLESVSLKEQNQEETNRNSSSLRRPQECRNHSKQKKMKYNGDEHGLRLMAGSCKVCKV